MKTTLLFNLLLFCSVFILSPLSAQGAAPCTAQITVSTSTTFCPGGEVILQANTGNNLTYQWLRDGTAIAGATANSYRALVAGAYQVRVAGGTCQTSTSASVSVAAAPAPVLPEFKIYPQAEVCTRTNVSFSVLAPQPGIVYTWQFGDGATASGAAVTHSYQEANLLGVINHTVRVTARNDQGCETIYEKPLRVYNKPVAKFRYTLTPASATQAAQVSIKNESEAGSLLYWGITPWDREANGPGEFEAEEAVLEVKEEGAYTLFMVVSNGFCADTTRQTITVLSGVPAAPGVITGLAEVCAGSTVAYTVPPVNGAAGYSWSVPNGWAVVSGQRTNQITVRVGNMGGLIRVHTYNAYGQSQSRHMDVSVINEVPAKPPAISGSVSVCAGSEASYSVPLTEGVTEYRWTVPAGWAITSLQDTTHIKVRVGAAGGVIRVTAGNSCGHSVATDLAVSISHPISFNTVEGNQSICSGQQPASLTGAVPAGGNGAYTYLWESSTTSATEGFMPAPGANNRSNYSPGLLSRTTWFRRRAGSLNCEVTSDAVKVEVKAVPGKPAIEQLGEEQLRASVVGEHYEWRRGDVVLPVSSRAIPIEGAGTYTVRVRDAGGCFSPYSDALQVTITGLANEARAIGVGIQPNPSKGKVTIKTREPLQQVRLQVVNLLGQVVLQRQLPHVKDEAELELSHLPDGIYLLLIQTPNIRLKQKLLLQR